MKLLLERFKTSENLKKVVVNSGWILCEKGIRLILGLLVGAWVARYLGPSLYGELAYVLAFLAFFQVISVLGMDGVIVRDISKKQIDASTLLGTALVLRIISGITCWIIAIILMGLLNGWKDNSVIITALAGGTLLFQSSDTIDLWFQSQSQSRRTVVMKMIALIISNGVKVLLIINNASLFLFAAIISIEGLLSAFGLSIAYRKFPCKNPWSINLQLIKRLLGESWPFILSGLSIIIYMRIDQILIKEMLGNKQLGIYSAVLTLSMMWSVLPVALSVSFAPFLARKKAQSERIYKITLSRLFRVFALLGWVICLPTFIFSDELVGLLYGVEYQSGALVLKIVIFTNIFINMGVAQSLWILNEGKSKLSFYKTSFGAIVCLALNYILIPQYGIVGAAIAAVLAQFSSTVMINVILCRDIFVLQIRSLFLLNSKRFYE